MPSARVRRVTQSLLRLGDAEAFCASHREPAAGLAVEVRDAGRFALPLAAPQIEKLIAIAEPSPFGYRDETRHDTSVRDSWEISGDRIQLDERIWSGRLGRALDEIRAGLGFPAGAEVKAELHKLVIYGEGQFFAPHRDAEKDPTLWATLVVVLPSSYGGGDLVITHAGRTVTHATSEAGLGYLSFIGFYADCLHETRPVTSGHRVALAFRLRVTSTDARPALDAAAHGRLSHDIERFFQDEDEDEAPWLVVLLDHHYTEQSLGWTRLKNADRTRVEALRQVAGRLDAQCYLAIANVEEWFDYDEGEEDDDEDDGEEDDDVEREHPALDAEQLGPQDDSHSPVLNELMGVPLSIDGAIPRATRAALGMSRGLQLTLDHWIDGDGARCESVEEEADDSCVVTTIGAEARQPYQLEASPWTGNEGGDATQWYHQAAFVLIPRSSHLNE